MGFFGNSGGLLRESAALKHLKASVMVADQDLTIVYVNDAAMTLMREAEAVLKAELPRFSVATLLGSNIDIFHKNPAHQRKMLAGLDRVHEATIKVGTRTFDLTITPLTEAGARHGFAVEWFDASIRLQNQDYAGKIHAIDRTQATIDFLPDGTILDANENFLRLMGYTKAEIVGRHHRMFVAADDQAKPDYAALWSDLASGRARSGEFKRIAKSGHTVWIEGNYNPIPGPDGRVVKVMKIASDSTKKVQLLGDLKRIIDENFTEIDRALTQSVNEADSASSAAGQTLTTVQTVASGTEELAASIREIAASMARSQAATDEAFNQAVAVAENTGKLSQAAREMNGIVDLIRKIAGQINLLALNATIEAARAGEAGRGFAVVASEVKDLANQSARATQRISQEIAAIQLTAGDVAGTLDHIRQSVASLREYVTATASAVEEQNAVTGSISRDMQSAAETVATTSMSISGISAAVSLVSQAVSKTKQAAAVLIR